MKKALLCASAAMMALTAMATREDGYVLTGATYQTIPSEQMLDLSNINYFVYTWPEDEAESPKDRVTPLEEDGVLVDNVIGNVVGGDRLEMLLNNTDDSTPMLLSFWGNSKNDGGKIYLEITQGSDIEFSTTIEVSNTGQWNSWKEGVYTPYEIYIEDGLSMGNLTLTMTFENLEANNVVNIRNFYIRATEPISFATLYTYVDPSDEAGTITLSPKQAKYITGTSITMTASANTGYKFLYWEDSYGDQYTDNPYTLVIAEDTDITAVFQELKMYSDIPGEIDLDTILQGGVTTESKACKLWDDELGDYDNYNDGELTHYLCNYRHAGSESFELNATKAGSYTMICPMASKAGDNTTPYVTYAIYDKDTYYASGEPEWTETVDVELTGNWQRFKTYTLEGITLTEGRKILTLGFFEPVTAKYTANILYIRLGIGDDFGSNDTPEEPGNDDDALTTITVTGTTAIRAYNAQGIAIDPATARGLVIYSDGTKAFVK